MTFEKVELDHEAINEEMLRVAAQARKAKKVPGLLGPGEKVEEDIFEGEKYESNFTSQYTGGHQHHISDGGDAFKPKEEYVKKDNNVVSEIEYDVLVRVGKEGWRAFHR